MTTRYNAKPKSRYGVSALPTGYLPPESDLYIPPVGLMDVDTALFKLFDDEINLQVTSKHDNTQKVPIVFAAGEKWAMLKRGKAIRDRNGSLVLPVLTIVRSNIAQTPSEDIMGRGINQQTGELIVKHRLDARDRDYQRLINRLLLKNQDSLALTQDTSDLTTQPIATDRNIGDLSGDPNVRSGALFMNNRKKNIYEIIVLPTPQFYTATYEVIVWAQYLKQMNEIIEGLIASFLPQGNAWLLNTVKGYWFVATVDGNLFNAQNNFEDMSTEERMIKYQFSIRVPAYMFATQTPGKPVPVRRYVSSPDVQFSLGVSSEASQDSDGDVDDPFLGVDDPTLPSTTGDSDRPDRRSDLSTRLFPDSPNNASSRDPALRGRDPARYSKLTVVDSRGNKSTKYVKIKSRNPTTGETVYSSTDLAGLSIVAVDS